MNLKLATCFIGFICSIAILHAQEKNDIKFGKIDPKDFDTKIYAVDSNAAAVILIEKGATNIVGNNSGWFSLEFKLFKRIHILNKSGYDIADIEVPLYTSGSATEELNGLKAVTYNLENGKVIETKLDKSAVFTDKRSKRLVVKKFTLPNIKEGSIVDLEYTLKSDFLFNLQPWSFQGYYPRIWSEYTVSMPKFLGYITLSQGYHPFHIKDSKAKTQHFTIIDNSGTQASERYSLTSPVMDYKWVMKDVPGLKEESFTSTVNNHISKIEFQLAEFRDPLTPKQIMNTWPKTASELMADEDFGATLKKDNAWLGDYVKPLIASAKNDREKAVAIYNYVRDNFTCTSYNGIYLRQTLKNIAKTKTGTVADINLLLTAMLNYAGLFADPVILSTRSHGYTYELYPIMERFNYVVAHVNLDGKSEFLDATHSRLGFAKLTPDCYNGHARIIDAQATPVDLLADNISENAVVSVFLAANKDGKIEGKLKKIPGYYESYRIRDKIKENGKESFFKDMKSHYTSMNLVKTVIEHEDKLDEHVQLDLDFVLDNNDEEILYINPLFGEGYKNNPFKSEERKYPVEMPYTMNETIVLSFQVPEGYVVDEIPKSMRVRLNEDDDGEFEYILASDGKTISMRCRIAIKRAVFLPEEYEQLREFFNLVVKKQNEQIVLKKKARP